MKTSIVINDHLLTTAMNLSGLKTKNEVMEEALSLMIRLLNQKSIKDLRGKLKWEGDLEQMRTAF